MALERVAEMYTLLPLEMYTTHLPLEMYTLLPTSLKCAPSSPVTSSVVIARVHSSSLQRRGGVGLQA